MYFKRLNSNLSNGQIFFAIVTLNMIISWIFQKCIMTKSFYYKILSEQIEINRIDKYIDILQGYTLWGYILFPIILLLKFSLISFLLQFFLLLKNIDIPMRQIFRTVMLASLMLSLALVLQIVILSVMPSKDITHNILKTVPLSLTHIFDLYKYPESSIIVFNAINPFEFLWIIIIYRGLVKTEAVNKVDCFVIVLSVWTTVLVFSWASIFYLNKINV